VLPETHRREILLPECQARDNHLNLPSHYRMVQERCQEIHWLFSTLLIYNSFPDYFFSRNGIVSLRIPEERSPPCRTSNPPFALASTATIALPDTSATGVVCGAPATPPVWKLPRPSLLNYRKRPRSPGARHWPTFRESSSSDTMP